MPASSRSFAVRGARLGDECHTPVV
jgi:hypothetical protein